MPINEYRRSIFALLSLFALFLPLYAAPTSVGAVMQTESDAAGEFAYGLSGLEAQGNFDQLYKLMHPDAKALIPRSAVVGWYRAEFAPQEPQTISEITNVRQVSWTWPVTGYTYQNAYEVDYVQPFGTGSDVTYRTDTVRLVPSGNNFGWFFGRSQEFVDEQIARFPGTVESIASESNQDNNRTPASSAQPGSGDCTLVELYPGYPGYRGNITGVMPHWNGLGDYECLETLDGSNAAFDRAREDRANRDAAEALGINGPMDLWTWENWMQIEAERGMVPSCYTCLMLDTSTEPYRTDVDMQPGDLRLLTGLSGRTQAIHGLWNSSGAGSGALGSIERIYNSDDYGLRAHAYLSGGPSMNAEELYREMEQVYQDWWDFDRDINVRFTEVMDTAIWDLGGYTWVPDNAAPMDQGFLMTYAISVALIGLSSEMHERYWYELDQTLSRWDGSVPLDTFMRQGPVWQAIGS